MPVERLLLHPPDHDLSDTTPTTGAGAGCEDDADTNQRLARARRGARLGIRARTTTVATCIVAAGLVTGAILLVVFVQRSLVAGLDDANAARARDVTAITRTTPLPATVASTGADNAIVQVVGPANTVLSASSNITGEPAVLAGPPRRRATTTFTTRSLPTADVGQSFRLLAEPVQLSSGPGWIYVATPLGQVEASVSRISTLLTVGVPFLVVLVAAVTWMSVGRALSPVERIRQSAAAIGGGARLRERLPIPPARDEITRLAVTMNQMLDRLEAAADRQQRFIGDVSHELRSPLTALQAQVDVALTQHADHPETPHTRVLRHVAQQARRLHLLIDDMLFLARADEQQSHPDNDQVDLDELLLAEVHRLRRNNGPAIVLVELNPTRIAGSARDLARMLKNIGDNAVSHTQNTVSLSLHRTPEEAVLTVIDDGPGIPAKDRTIIFNRFTRLDQARARPDAGAGAGLGLAIAQQIAHRHGGAITINNRPDQTPGAAFTIRLPLTPPTG
jgi:signal transduction histidine kinase